MSNSILEAWCHSINNELPTKKKEKEKENWKKGKKRGEREGGRKKERDWEKERESQCIPKRKEKDQIISDLQSVR